MRLLIINGPNLNMLGKRQPDVYGYSGFEEYLNALIGQYPAIQFDFFQSNGEGAIIDRMHEAEGQVDGIILNAAAYTHTSIAIADAVQAITVPVVEVHISNVYAREAYRQHSYLSAYCKGIITGFGLTGYRLAVESFLS